MALTLEVKGPFPGLGVVFVPQNICAQPNPPCL